MDAFFEPYADPRALIPVGAMFLILFAIIFRTLQEMPLFPDDKATQTVVSLGVTTLAMYGMDQMMIRPLLLTYSAMGYAMLVGLAAMLLAAWIGILVKSRPKK